jgi:hypothetical protein
MNSLSLHRWRRNHTLGWLLQKGRPRSWCSIPLFRDSSRHRVSHATNTSQREIKHDRHGQRRLNIQWTSSIAFEPPDKRTSFGATGCMYSSPTSEWHATTSTISFRRLGSLAAENDRPPLIDRRHPEIWLFLL